MSPELLQAAWAWLTQVWPPLVGGLGLLAALAAAGHAVLSKRSAQSALAWVALIALVPLLGATLYLLFGVNRIRRAGQRLRDRRRGSLEPEDPLERDLRQTHAQQVLTHLEGRLEPLNGLRILVERVTGAALLGGNDIRLLRDGDQAYPAMLQAIDAARHTVLLSTYIFDLDEAGQRFVDALVAAHQRGVRVHVIIDSVGARYSWPTSLSALRRAGVPAQAFMPVLRPGRLSLFMNLRTHRKIMVVDGVVGFTGGINIRHGHMVAHSPAHPAHDAHFHVRGPVVFHLQRALVDDWFFCAGERLRGEGYFPARYEPAGQVAARGIPDGPDGDEMSLQWTLLGALQAARRGVTIITPYFIPEESLLSALQIAALRGVAVDLILPERSNLPFVDWASEAMWEPLLEVGVRLWRVGGAFDHAKLMVIDGRWTLFGSCNWDPRSLKLNFEFNVEAYDEALAASVMALARAKRAQARAWTLEDHRARGLAARARSGLARLAAPYL